MTIGRLNEYLAFYNVKNIKSTEMIELLHGAAAQQDVAQLSRKEFRLKAAMLKNIKNQKGEITLFEVLMVIADLNLTNAEKIRSQLVFYSGQPLYHCKEATPERATPLVKNEDRVMIETPLLSKNLQQKALQKGLTLPKKTRRSVKNRTILLSSDESA